MTNPAELRVIHAADAPPRTKPTNYPAEFAGKVAGRQKRTLGDLFGLKNFGVNLTRLAPGAQSALLHRHSRQDEFVYVLEGEAVLVTQDGEFALKPGDCAGFAAGGVAHMLINRSGADMVYLEIGDRSPGDVSDYPREDLQAVMQADGTWGLLHKDGRSY